MQVVLAAFRLPDNLSWIICELEAGRMMPGCSTKHFFKKDFLVSKEVVADCNPLRSLSSEGEKRKGETMFDCYETVVISNM